MILPVEEGCLGTPTKQETPSARKGEPDALPVLGERREDVTLRESELDRANLS